MLCFSALLNHINGASLPIVRLRRFQTGPWRLQHLCSTWVKYLIAELGWNQEWCSTKNTTPRDKSMIQYLVFQGLTSFLTHTYPYPTVQVALCTCQGFGGTSVTGEIARSNLRGAAGDESLLRVWLKISEPVVRSMSQCFSNS